jgi:hypothetical protein
MTITVEQLRARFERLAKSGQPEVKVAGRTLQVKLDDRLIAVNQAGASTLSRRVQSRYR